MSGEQIKHLIFRKIWTERCIWGNAASRSRGFLLKHRPANLRKSFYIYRKINDPAPAANRSESRALTPSGPLIASAKGWVQSQKESVFPKCPEDFWIWNRKGKMKKFSVSVLSRKQRKADQREEILTQVFDGITEPHMVLSVQMLLSNANSKPGKHHSDLKTNWTYLVGEDAEKWLIWNFKL